jgi:hypothetical protein
MFEVARFVAVLLVTVCFSIARADHYEQGTSAHPDNGIPQSLFGGTIVVTFWEGPLAIAHQQVAVLNPGEITYSGARSAYEEEGFTNGGGAFASLSADTTKGRAYLAIDAGGGASGTILTAKATLRARVVIDGVQQLLVQEIATMSKTIGVRGLKGQFEENKTLTYAEIWAYVNTCYIKAEVIANTDCTAPAGSGSPITATIEGNARMTALAH